MKPDFTGVRYDHMIDGFVGYVDGREVGSSTEGPGKCYQTKAARKKRRKKK